MKLYVVEMIHNGTVIPVGVSLDRTQAIIAGEQFQYMADTISMIKVKYRVSDYEIGKDCYTDFTTKKQIKVS